MEGVLKEGPEAGHRLKGNNPEKYKKGGARQGLFAGLNDIKYINFRRGN